MTTTRKSLLPQQIAPVVRNSIANPAGLRADSPARIAAVHASQIEQISAEEQFAADMVYSGDEDYYSAYSSEGDYLTLANRPQP